MSHEADGFIADLDAEIEERGETIRLRRMTSGPEGTHSVFEIKIPANVRSAAPSDLVDAGAADTVIVISPTHLAAKRFPGDPRKDDQIALDADPGDPMNIDEARAVRVGGVTVRWKLLCRGYRG